jgi:predicted nucleic acid-binding protein
LTSILLDTSVPAAYSNGRPAAVAFVDSLPAGSILATSVLCYGEVIEHLMSASDYPYRADMLRRLLKLIRPVHPSFEMMERYAAIRRDMRRQKVGLIGDFDTLIAATSLELGSTLATTDRDFLRIPNLAMMLLARRTYELIEQRP